MKNTFGNSLTVTIFGESHGEAIGAVLDGLAPGIEIDERYISSMLERRRPRGTESTARREEDPFRIVSGVFENRSTGTPLCILIPNKDTRSRDYDKMKDLPRPSHADYTAMCKYHGYQDHRGGGHFSGRLTAALVAAGAVILGALENRGIQVGTHISRCACIDDRNFNYVNADIERLKGVYPAVLDEEKGKEMMAAIARAASEGNSVGGVLETVITGLPAGIGEPWFDTFEGLMAHSIFSIPAVKGIEFGAGFACSDMTGSEANDPFILKDGRIATRTNNSGGINGGITNGMPVIFRTAVKPTPSIGREQETVNMDTGKETKVAITGRHDPAIIHRAVPVVDCVAAITAADMLAMRYGTDWLAGGGI